MISKNTLNIKFLVLSYILAFNLNSYSIDGPITIYRRAFEQYPLAGLLSTAIALDFEVRHVLSPKFCPGACDRKCHPAYNKICTSTQGAYIAGLTCCARTTKKITSNALDAARALRAARAEEAKSE